MSDLKHLLQANKAWAAKLNRDDPELFARLSAQQDPDYLWIGCSDSRVPANRVIDVQPGEVFVHRNIANVVAPGDANALSVIQYAVDALQVEHIIVCGHYGCGGVQAALAKSDHNQGPDIGDQPISAWLAHIQQVIENQAAELAATATEQRHSRLCELNVLAQVENVCNTDTVTAAWAKGQPLKVHGWIYNIADGLLHVLQQGIGSENELQAL